MARKPFFSGNYGSALARVDTRPIMEAGRAQGQMYANMGSQIGGMIQQYGLNKEKRAKLTGEIEAYYKENPNALGEIGMSGDEAQDKKDFTEREKFVKGDMSMAQLEGYAGKLARGDVLKTKNAQNEARAIANEMSRVNLDITKQLKDTQIQLVKDKGTLSSINAKVAEMRERGLTKEEENMLNKLNLTGRQIDSELNNLDYKTEAEKQEALLRSATNKTNIRLVEPRAEATEAALETSVMQNEATQQLLPGQTSLAIKKQGLDSKNIDAADLLLKAFGGAEGKAEFDYQGAKLSRKNLKLGMKVLSQKGDYYDYLATAKNVPVDTKKQYASIVSDIGKLTDTLVKDPDTGNQITFTKYMELANDDPDLYPLTGANSGPAGRLYGSFITAQKQADDLLKTTQVQVDDGQGAGGSPTNTGSPMPFSQSSPQEAMKALRDRIGELRRLGPDINARRQQLGQPGQFNPIGMGGNFRPTQVPQTVGYIQQQNDALTQQEEQRKSELAEAEAQLQELQNQFGVR